MPFKNLVYHSLVFFYSENFAAPHKIYHQLGQFNYGGEEYIKNLKEKIGTN